MKKIRYFTAAAMSVCLWAVNMVPAFAWESVSMEMLQFSGSFSVVVDLCGKRPDHCADYENGRL